MHPKEITYMEKMKKIRTRVHRHTWVYKTVQKKKLFKQKKKKQNNDARAAAAKAAADW